MFEGTNYINGPFAVGKFWATKFVMHLRDPTRVAWYTDSVEAYDEFSTNLLQMSQTSPLIAALLKRAPAMRPYAVRHLKSVTRERVSFEREEWVLIERGSYRLLARVRDMVECRIESDAGVHSVIRLWCDSCVTPKHGTDGELWANHTCRNDKTIVALEEVQITPKTRNTHVEHAVFT